MLGVVIYRFGIQFLYRTHALKPAIYEHILNYLLSFRILRGQFVARVYKRTHTNTLITSPKSALVR